MSEEFLRNEKNDEREVHTISQQNQTVLSKYLAEFIRSVRRKDGVGYKPSGLRRLL